MIQFIEFTDSYGKTTVVNVAEIVKLRADGRGPWDLTLSNGENVSISDDTAREILDIFSIVRATKRAA